MARGGAKQQAAAADAEPEAALPKGAVVDDSDDRVYIPVKNIVTNSEDVQSTDTVADVLAGNYTEGIVDEVRAGAFGHLSVLASRRRAHRTCMLLDIIS
jgi:hypothetical protein